MFCNNCGKEIANKSKFCKYCGASLNDEPIQGIMQNYGGNTTYNLVLPISTQGNKLFLLLALIGSTFFVSIGGILPLVSVEMFSYSESYNLPQLWKVVETFSRMGIDADTINNYKLFLTIPCIAFILSAVFGLKFFVSFFSGIREHLLAASSIVSMGCGLVGIGLITFYRFAINYRIKEEFYDIDVLLGTNMIWALLIVELVNLIVLIPGYLGVRIGERILGRPSLDEYIENERNVGEKVCLRCRTRFMFGDRCPSCGSPAVEKEKN